MSSVGLSFGSPTSGQGFDVTTTVNAIVTNLQSAETPYKTQLTTLQNQDTVFSNLGTLLSTLSTDVGNLTDFQGVMAAKNGSSSNTSVLNLVSAGTSAVAGTHTLTVSKLAQTSSVLSSTVAAADTLSGSIWIEVGDGKSQQVTVPDSEASLAGLAGAINEANIGVTAQIVTNSTGQSLSIVSQTSGAAGELTVDSTGLLDTSAKSAALTFSVGQTAQDAQFTVDGIPHTNSSNTVTNGISGVTLQLTGTSDSLVEVEITNDTSSIATTVSTVVTDYNAVVKAMNAQEGKDASGNAEPLFGSPVLSGLQSVLQGILSFNQTDGIKNPAALGITMSSDGTLTLDSDTLSSVLDGSFQDVVGFFQNAGSFGQKLESAVNSSGSTSSTGALALAEKQNASMESNLNATIAKLESNIDAQKTNLTTELNAANQTLEMIPTLLNSVDEMYAAITGYSSSKS